MSVQTCEAFCYADASSTDLWKQWKAGGPFAPYYATGNRGKQRLLTTDTDSTVDSPMVIEGYTLRYPSESQKYWYAIFHCIWVGMMRGQKQIYFISDAFDKYDDFFKLDNGQRLKSELGEWFKGTLWQCATQNGYFDVPNERGDNQNFLSNVNDYSFIYETVGNYKYIIGVDITNCINSNVYNSIFYPNAAYEISNTKGKIGLIIKAATNVDAENWTEENKAELFEKLWAYICDHSCYDYRTVVMNEGETLVQARARLDDVLTNNTRPSKTGITNGLDLEQWYNKWAQLGVSGQYTANVVGVLKWKTNDVFNSSHITEWAYQPSVLSMINKLYSKPWENATETEENGWPINEDYTIGTQDVGWAYYTKYFALGRCFEFGKLWKMFCDYIDEMSGCTKLYCKPIETQVHAHEWTMVNIDGEFKFFDPCSITCVTERNQRDMWMDMSENDKRGYTYNISVQNMIDTSSEFIFGYGNVYDDGCFIMRPIQEPLNPEHEAYSWKYYPTMTLDNAISAEKVLDGSCYGDYVCDATKDGETGVATVRIDAGGVGEPMFITKDIIDGLDSTFDEFIQNLAASDYYISANALKDSGWNLMYEKCKGDITFTISFPYTRPDWATVPDPVDYAAFIAWCKEHGVHFLVPGENYGVSSIESLFQSPEE